MAEHPGILNEKDASWPFSPLHTNMNINSNMNMNMNMSRNANVGDNDVDLDVDVNGDGLYANKVPATMPHNNNHVNINTNINSSKSVGNNFNELTTTPHTNSNLNLNSTSMSNFNSNHTATNSTILNIDNNSNLNNSSLSPHTNFNHGTETNKLSGVEVKPIPKEVKINSENCGSSSSTLSCSPPDSKSNMLIDFDLDIVPGPGVVRGGEEELAFRDFEMSCTSREIARVLESFNAILEDEERFISLSNDLDLVHLTEAGKEPTTTSSTSGVCCESDSVNLNVQNNINEGIVTRPENSSDNNNIESVINLEDHLRLADSFAHLLIGDEEDLLIVVDDEDRRSSSSALHNSNSNNNNNNNVDPALNSNSNLDVNLNHQSEILSRADSDNLENLEEEDNEDNVSECPDIDYPDYSIEDTEGYESDRPMVRASMRKLRPIQMILNGFDKSPICNQSCGGIIVESPAQSPAHSSKQSAMEMPLSSSSNSNQNQSSGSCSSNSKQPPPGLATTLNSPTTNKILLTSLINTIMSHPTNHHHHHHHQESKSSPVNCCSSKSNLNSNESCNSTSTLSSNVNNNNMSDNNNLRSEVENVGVQCTIVNEVVHNPIYGELNSDRHQGGAAVGNLHFSSSSPQQQQQQSCNNPSSTNSTTTTTSQHLLNNDNNNSGSNNILIDNNNSNSYSTPPSSSASSSSSSSSVPSISTGNSSGGQNGRITHNHTHQQSDYEILTDSSTDNGNGISSGSSSAPSSSSTSATTAAPTNTTANRTSTTGNSSATPTTTTTSSSAIPSSSGSSSQSQSQSQSQSPGHNQTTRTEGTSRSRHRAGNGGHGHGPGRSGNSSAGNGGGRSSPLTGAGLRMAAVRWPHRLSSVLALIGCTLGLNNICRFSLLSVEYGANFILQFLFLSLVFGIPLFTFHMSIGQYLSSGIVDMWRISPIFQGIGLGLVISQAMIGIYTAVGVSWVFIYFRDSFITRFDQYRWSRCLREYRDSGCDPYSQQSNLTDFAQSIPDYFNGVVLQRSSPEYPTSASLPTNLKFTVAFNLAVVWMLVFVSLSKGLKSYGKVVHGFVLIPVGALLVLASKMVGLVPSDQTLFGQTAWANFFFNSQTWVVAAREAFFTWGLLGACVMQVTSHNRFNHSLKSDASIVVLITTFVLLLGAFLGNACYSVLVSHGFSYVPSSFESDKTYKFLARTTNLPQTPETMLTTPIPSYYSQHISFLMGVRIIKPDLTDGTMASGYQALRLATELFPATMSLLGPTGLSPFWTVLFYFTFILFGIAQQIAIWHCVIRGVIAIKPKIMCSWEITITFCVCAAGFVFGLPLCTEIGIFITYFMDYAIGSGWWIMVLYLLELVAVFIVRGSPYSGECIVTVLMTGGKVMKLLAPLVSFIWNVILPVAMLVLSIASFKSGNIRELYDWNPGHGYVFWPSWTKEMGSFVQLVPILAVPFVAIIQSCRYLTNGPPDMFDRMQQLYRPNSRGLFGRALSAHLSGNTPATDYNGSANGSSNPGDDPRDDPPKYTPPPSFSTATGAKIAKFLRNSFRRSMRRLGAHSHSSNNSNMDNFPPPPSYNDVILEISAQQHHGQNHAQPQIPTISVITAGGGGRDPDNVTSSSTSSSSSSSSNSNNNDDSTSNSKRIYQIPLSQTLGRSLGETSKERSSLRRIASDITPSDISRLLRASFRRHDNTNDSTSDNNANSRTSNSSQNPAFQNNLNDVLEPQLYHHPGSTPLSRTISSPLSATTTTTLNIDSDFLRINSNNLSVNSNLGPNLANINYPYLSSHNSVSNSTSNHQRSCSCGSARIFDSGSSNSNTFLIDNSDGLPDFASATSAQRQLQNNLSQSSTSTSTQPQHRNGNVGLGVSNPAFRHDVDDEYNFGGFSQVHPISPSLDLPSPHSQSEA